MIGCGAGAASQIRGGHVQNNLMTMAFYKAWLPKKHLVPVYVSPVGFFGTNELRLGSTSSLLIPVKK